MPSYRFRLRFLLPKDTIIVHDTDALEINLNSAISPVIRLTSNIPNKTIKETNDLSLMGKGFSSEQEAYSFGNHLRNLLMYCATQRKMGIDCGKDKSTSKITNFLKDKATEQGFSILDNVHGLSIYPEGMPVSFFGFNAEVSNGQPSARFADDFKKAYDLSLNFSDKLLLAFELYGVSHFENSLRAKFISLITAIESVCVQDKHSLTVLSHLDELKDFTHANLDEPEKENILNGLERLKVESVLSACKKIISANLGLDNAKTFGKFYNIRSRILHDGRTPEDIDLGSEVPILDSMVSELLVKMAGARENNCTAN